MGKTHFSLPYWHSSVYRKAATYIWMFINLFIVVCRVNALFNIKNNSLPVKLKQHLILPENRASGGQIQTLVKDFGLFERCFIFVIERFIEIVSLSEGKNLSRRGLRALQQHFKAVLF